MNNTTTIPGIKKRFVPLKIFIVVLVFVGLGLFPFMSGNRFYISMINEMMIYGLLAMSLDVLLGYTGALSFMHNAYLGISAYVVGLFLIHISPASLWMACFAGIIFTSIVALPVGWVQVRTGGLAFALLTLAFGMMFHTIVWKWYDVTGGDDGLMGMPNPDITLFGWKLGSTGDPLAMYLFTLVIAAICFFLTRRIINSPFGAVLEAIRENEDRASFIGINVRRYKLLGWMLACLLAGISGALFILYKGYIGPSTMSAFAGAGVLMMVLLGGLGSLWGAFVGAAIFIYIQDYISTMTEHWEIFLGLVVIFLVLFLPTGFVGLGDHLKRFRKG
ncbi:MAG: branched-chain amino acid ABC transporter permease [Desulfobacula sp.]|jgi:branched-chain amino acid transport system permease protein|uniref:branched-chain amino acid ABC transporter permease n=1 Tax=Desulfobacula sp. TaxID=2593537 RepID=UPI001D1B0882|nr:branched-chain amino acid ABC transporter permease [Desulfobacula sp.]MBT3484178.1 branched-chain amino acid ABC transporter permease [Desulfobacula sp.]MBT3803708.1 branched-chain amino acid ABC transporter permease [Desulfobacula sp.]MBT4024413.1 branched-chain amino acid ABC transporter permease [Desulfobacula sp.]MBT4198454.1 branched-chain amino acid ABC transporter permease [Desulfobacula sp.]